jgi:hypothetical protein
MKNYILIIFLFLISGSVLYAQSVPEESPIKLEPESISLFSPLAYSGNIIIHQPTEVAELIGIKKAILKKQNGFYGYRIRIFSKSGSGARTEADKLRIEFKEKNPDINAYLVYSAPNWEIHIGNYRDRWEAMKPLQIVREEHPQSFILKTIIEFPELNNENE